MPEMSHVSVCQAIISFSGKFEANQRRHLGSMKNCIYLLNVFQLNNFFLACYNSVVSPRNSEFVLICWFWQGFVHFADLGELN